MIINNESIISFIEKYPNMNVKPSPKNKLIIQGRVSFDIMNEEHGRIIDEFLLEIRVPKTFPDEIPQVFELEKRIPRIADYHINNDSSLCLGSNLSIKKRIAETPTLDGFLEMCVIPFLFSMSLYLNGNKEFVFGELAHGTIGILQDYLEIFELETVPQVLELIDILCMKKNIGNKMLCPCGCNRIIVKCKTHKKVSEYRNTMSRRDFKNERAEIDMLWERVKQFQGTKRIPLA